MSKVHPRAREFATDWKLTIDEKAGFLELNGDYDLAVIVNLKGMNSSVEPPEHVSYVRSRVPGEAIAFFSHAGNDHLKFGFAQFENRIELQRWDWSTANLPEPWDLGPPWDSINRYVAALSHQDQQEREYEELVQFEIRQQEHIQAAREEEKLRREEEKKRQREEEAAKKREAHLAALPEELRAFVDAGMTHELTIDPWGRIGGAYRFIRLAHVDSNGYGKDEPRPERLPWISDEYGLWVAVPKDEVPGETTAREVKQGDLGFIRDAVWPESLAEYAPGAFDELLYEREAHRLRKPDFFAPDLHDADADEPYLVAGLLPEEGISLFAGEWDSGKTILLVDLAAHIACGLPWLKRPVSPRPVIYYALEAGDDVAKRLCATNEKLKLGENAPIGTGTVPVRLEDKIPHDYEEWREQIQRLEKEICDRVEQRCEDQGLEYPEDYVEMHPGVVVIDTLRQACSHKSRGPEVEEFFSKADRLVQDGVASHVIIAHHTTKTGDEYAGDDFLASDSTSLYYVRRPNHDKPMFRLMCDRVKGIGKPPAINLLFKVVEVGKQQTVVLAGEANASPKLLEIAKNLPARIPMDGLREELKPYLTGKTDSARYKSFQRLRDKLVKAGLIAPEASEYVRST